jgi:hypothetical protein
MTVFKMFSKACSEYDTSPESESEGTSGQTSEQSVGILLRVLEYRDSTLTMVEQFVIPVVYPNPGGHAVIWLMRLQCRIRTF